MIQEEAKRRKLRFHDDTTPGLCNPYQLNIYLWKQTRGVPAQGVHAGGNKHKRQGDHQVQPLIVFGIHKWEHLFELWPEILERIRTLLLLLLHVLLHLCLEG